MNNFTLKDIVLNAILGAAYVALMFVFAFSSFGEIQFRIAEMLLVLVIFNKKLAPGLILGTFLGNLLLSPLGVIDALVGSVASILALFLMIIFRKKPFISLIFPAITNGIIVGLMITLLEKIPYYLTFTWVFLGEVAVMYSLGLIIYLYIKELFIKE